MKNITNLKLLVFIGLFLISSTSLISKVQSQTLNTYLITIVGSDDAAQQKHDITILKNYFSKSNCIYVPHKKAFLITTYKSYSLQNLKTDLQNKGITSIKNIKTNGSQLYNHKKTTGKLGQQE